MGDIAIIKDGNNFCLTLNGSEINLNKQELLELYAETLTQVKDIVK